MTKAGFVTSTLVVVVCGAGLYGCREWQLRVAETQRIERDQHLAKRADERDAKKITDAQRDRIQYMVAFADADDFKAQVEELGMQGFVPVATTERAIVFAHRSSVLSFIEQARSNGDPWLSFDLESDEELNAARDRVRGKP